MLVRRDEDFWNSHEWLASGSVAQKIFCKSTVFKVRWNPSPSVIF